MKHTPLPWRVLPQQSATCDMTARRNIHLKSNDGNTICAAGCQVWHQGGDDAEAEADARFIVEACNNYERVKEERDALYEALEAVVRIADRATVEFDQARAALAKARGEA